MSDGDELPIGLIVVLIFTGLWILIPFVFMMSAAVERERPQAELNALYEGVGYAMMAKEEEAKQQAQRGGEYQPEAFEPQPEREMSDGTSDAVLCELCERGYIVMSEGKVSRPCGACGSDLQ